MARAVELNREHRLPAPGHELAILDEQGCEPGEKQLPAVRVAVDRLVEGDRVGARKVVVLVAGVAGCKAFEQLLEVAQEERLAFVGGESARRGERREGGGGGRP